jgi:L-fuconolactonase
MKPVAKDYVDAHHHVWKIERDDYGWLTPELEPIYRDFSLKDLAPLSEWANVETHVLVQAAPTFAETKYLLDVATESEGKVRGVVGWVDLASRNAIPTLTRLSRERFFKGVRPMLQDLPDADWILRKEVQSALAALPRLGLRLDALIKPPHLRALLAVIESHPDLAIVIDHAAKPAIAAGMWEPWAGLIRAASQSPKVRCKLSGLPNEAGPDWTIDTLRPYVDHVFECFGPDRIMWGSDWPVVELGGGYKRWRAATVALLQHLGPEERDAVLGGTARRFYGLD